MHIGDWPDVGPWAIFPKRYASWPNKVPLDFWKWQNLFQITRALKRNNFVSDVADLFTNALEGGIINNLYQIIVLYF